MEQMALFAELPCGHRVRAKRRPCKKELHRPIGEQLSFALTQRTEWVNEDDDPWITAPIVKRTVSARDAAPMVIAAPASVWDMAFAPISIKPMAGAGKAKILKVVRAGGITKVVPIMPQDTEEWKAREVARRAKQRPPKPTAAFKSMSKTFQNLIN